MTHPVRPPNGTWDIRKVMPIQLYFASVFARRYGVLVNIIPGRSSVGCWSLWLLLALARWSMADTSTTSAVRYPVGGKMWPESELRAAYVKVRTFHVVDPGRQQVVPAGAQRAFPLQGKLRDRIRAGRLVVESADGRMVAVQCDPLVASAFGEEVDLMVCPAATPWLSYEPSTDRRRSLPFFQDVTLPFAVFVTALQRGYHFPEAPELGTQEGRKGRFRTERVKLNKVEDR